jgi:hypothetical protein
MSKPEMKKLKIKSPNMADAVMMAMFYEKKEVEEGYDYVPKKRVSSW